MCGRYAFTKIDKKNLAEHFHLKEAPITLQANTNIMPASQVPAILNASSEKISFVRWGLIPSWTKEENISDCLFNARAETITEKPSFKKSFQERRCLILADAFYEWEKVNGRKRPFKIMLKNENIFAFAGIWDIWRGASREIYSCSIITTTPNDLIKNIHDRMPVILPKEKEKKWLDEIDMTSARALLQPFDASQMKICETTVSSNSSRKLQADLFMST